MERTEQMLNRTEQIRLIVEYMGFERKYPKASIESDMSLWYFWPKSDKTFDDGLYVTNAKSCSSSQTGLIEYESINIRSIFDITKSKFDSSYAWIMPVVDKIEAATGDTFRITSSYVQCRDHTEYGSNKVVNLFTVVVAYLSKL